MMVRVRTKTTIVQDELYNMTKEEWEEFVDVLGSEEEDKFIRQLNYSKLDSISADTQILSVTT